MSFATLRDVTFVRHAFFAFALCAACAVAVGTSTGCDEDTEVIGSPAANADPDAAPVSPTPPTVVDAGPVVDGEAGPLAVLDPSRHFKDPTRIRYTQRPFMPGSPGCDRYSSVDADLVAKTMIVDECGHAGGVGVDDAGFARRSITLTNDEAASLIMLVESLRQDLNAKAQCSGFDGTSHLLLLTVGGSANPTVIDARHEYICSGPPPGMRIESAGFIALREKLHLIAGLGY